MRKSPLLSESLERYFCLKLSFIGAVGVIDCYSESIDFYTYEQLEKYGFKKVERKKLTDKFLFKNVDDKTFEYTEDGTAIVVKPVHE